MSLSLFTPVMITRGDYHGRTGELRGRTLEERPRYDAVLEDGTTVVNNLRPGDFAITGKPRAVRAIPWEGTQA